MKKRFSEMPNIRDERQFAVKDKTQNAGFGLKRNGLLVKREGRHRKQPMWTLKVHTHSLGGEMKAILVSPRTQAKNSLVKLMLNKRYDENYRKYADHQHCAHQEQKGVAIWEQVQRIMIWIYSFI